MRAGIQNELVICWDCVIVYQSRDHCGFLFDLRELLVEESELQLLLKSRRVRSETVAACHWLLPPVWPVPSLLRQLTAPGWHRSTTARSPGPMVSASSPSPLVASRVAWRWKWTVLRWSGADEGPCSVCSPRSADLRESPVQLWWNDRRQLRTRSNALLEYKVDCKIQQ